MAEQHGPHRAAAAGGTAPEDPLDRAVRLLGDPAAGPLSGSSRSPDALTDALSIVGSALARPACPPDDAAEAALGPVEGTVAASGWLAWRVRLGDRWRSGAVVPMLVDLGSGPEAVLPAATGARVVGRDRRPRRPRPVDPGPQALAFAVDLPVGGGWWGLLRWSLSRQWVDVLLLVVLAAVGGLAALLLPTATAALFQSAVPAGDLVRAGMILVGFGVASLGAVLVGFGRIGAVVRLRDRMDGLLSPGAMAAVLRLRAGFFRRRSVGDVANRAMSVESARALVDDGVVSLMVSSAFGLTGLAYLLVAGPVVGLATLVAVVVVLAACLGVQFRARSRLPGLLARRSDADATLLSVLDGLVSWRVAAAEDRALARWARDQQASTGALRARLAAVSLAEPFQLAGTVVVVAAFTAAVVVAPSPQLQPGVSTAAGAYLAMYAAVMEVTIAMISFGDSVMAMSEYGPVLARLDPVRDADPERGARAAHPGALRGDIRLDRVTFGYRRDQSPLFTGLCLDVPAGQFLAVVGPSGSGKSTLLRLLLGFEQPWEGSVHYDGHDLAGLDPAAVRRQLGVVLQASQPLGRTVRECVTGPRDLDDEQVTRLLGRAGMSEELAGGSLTLDTPVGRHGSGLSGGQRQRLMIAAALAGDPAVLLLDEATSALDNRTQSAVTDALLAARCTRIVVAHRLSTVRQADRVVVVADGRIVEDGTPRELLAAGGRFAALAARQEL